MTKTSYDLSKLDEVIGMTFRHYAKLNQKSLTSLFNDAIAEFIEQRYGDDLNRIAMIEYLNKHYKDAKRDMLLDMYMYILDSNISDERGKMNPTLRLEILQRDGLRCCYCGRRSSDGVVLHVDHIIPIELGGRTRSNNLQTLCNECNAGKSDHIIDVPPKGDNPYYDYFYDIYIKTINELGPEKSKEIVTRLDKFCKRWHTDRITASGIIFMVSLDNWERDHRNDLLSP
jgi:hypothetical protein